MFIGRAAELKYLEERYNSDRAELIVLYGRRRIGKTELLRQFAADKNALFYACTECTDEEQRRRFSKRLLNMDIPAARYTNSFADWELAFRAMADIPATGKKIVILDEFPYMANGNPSIPSILQNLWDEFLQHENIMLILCGSSLSFMEKELLAEKNPLYGRATGIYKLEPLSFAETRKFFPRSSLEEQIIYYAILGGIPHYLCQFKPDLSPKENIENGILSRGSVLYSEVEFLLHQELRETAVYNVIIEAVAQGATTLNEIHERTQLESVKIQAYLRNLMELDVINREFSVLAKEKEKTLRGRGLYKIVDPYFRFWYAFIYSNASEISFGNSQNVYKYIIEPQLPEFVAPVFENVCIEALRLMNKRGELPFYFSKIGRWWDKVTHNVDGKKKTVAEEIDIAAIDSLGKNYLLGECKYRRGKANLSVLTSLKQKFPYNIYSGNFYYAIFSLFGIEENLQNAADGNVLLFDGADLDRILDE